MRSFDKLLATVVAGSLGALPVYAHLAEGGQDAVESASEASGEADPIAQLPRMLQQEVRGDLETRRNAVQRFMIMLSASDAQRQAIVAEHDRLIEQYAAAALPPLAADAEGLLDELIARVSETQPFKKRAAGEQLSSQERIQIQRFLAASELGAKANALMGTELAEEARAIDNDMRAQMWAAWRRAFDVFLASAQGVLTDDQAERVYAAVHAYECQLHRSGPERAAGPPSRMTSGGAAKWIDARMLLDPRIEPMSDLPTQAVALRETIAEQVPSIVATGSAIAALVEQYEARQVQYKRQLDRIHERGSATMDDVVEAITDEQQGQWTVDLQQQVATVLAEEAPSAIAALWTEATNRLIHRGVYRRWDRIDHEFDAAIKEATAGDAPDEDLLEALRALRMQYIAETDELERQLVTASQATMGINTLRPDTFEESEKNALRALRERIQHAIDRRAWYRARLAEMGEDGGGNASQDS